MTSQCVTLNLDNFENECLSSASPYVLTSPTSLRACSKLLIEPSELIYKSLEEYEEDLAGLPLSEIYRIYEENETERQEKLLKCRELRKVLQLKPYEDQRQRLIKIRQLQPIKMKRNSNSNSTDQVATSNKSSPQRKQVTLQYSSDTESVDGEREEVVAAEGNNTSPGVNPLRHIYCKEEDTIVSRKDLSIKSSSCGRIHRHPGPTSSSSRSISRRQSLHLPSPRRVQSCKSVPNISSQRGNLYFPKIKPNHYCLVHEHDDGHFHHHHRNHHHHYLCQCPNLLSQYSSDKELIQNYMKSYGSDLILPSFLSSDDQKILQLMLLKKGRAIEWDKRAAELRRIIEYEKVQRNRLNQLANQKLYEKICEKRKLENFENTQRFLKLEQKANEQREALRKYLENRDRKVQNYLTTLAEQKNKEISEKHKMEALKQLEVGKAIERLLEQDQEHRLVLAENLQKRMTNAEIRKRRREQDHWRHIYEMNRLDDEKRQLKHEQIERTTQASIQQLRNQIEEKEAKSTLNYLNQLKLRYNLPKDRSKKHEEAIAKAQLLHNQLLKGLDEWYKKIFELHLAAQEKATLNYRQQLTRRTQKLINERNLREEKSLERQKKLQEEEIQKKALIKSIIETKEMKSNRIQLEKERKITFSRRRAQHAAELRQQLKEKLDPDTFDKKVARVEIELRIMKKHGPPGGSYGRLKSINVSGGNNNNGTCCWVNKNTTKGLNLKAIQNVTNNNNGKSSNNTLGMKASRNGAANNNVNGNRIISGPTTTTGRFNNLSMNGKYYSMHQQSCRCGCRCRSRNLLGYT